MHGKIRRYPLMLQFRVEEVVRKYSQCIFMPVEWPTSERSLRFVMLLALAHPEP